MAKFKGAKWAQILTLMAAIAASIVSGVTEAKTYAKDYADGLKDALVAGDVKYTSANFNGGSQTTVAAALEALYSSISGQEITVSTTSTTTGMLKSYTFMKGSNQLCVIDIPKDYVNNIIGIVTKDGNNQDGIFLKVNTAPTGADTPVYEYIDVSGLVEYLTLGDQTGKMVTLSISSDHKITADIADATLTKAKMVQSVQDSLDAADSALQEDDFEWATDNEVNTSWAAAMTAASTPAQAGE